MYAPACQKVEQQTSKLQAINQEFPSIAKKQTDTAKKVLHFLPDMLFVNILTGDSQRFKPSPPRN